MLTLLCEYKINPIGIENLRPRLSWIESSAQRGQRQTAYQIIAASSLEMLSHNKADKWDSGKVASTLNTHITYEGNKLTSGEACFWKVRYWNQEDEVSNYSEPATFEMALLHSEDWTGIWIAGQPGISSPLLRREFTLMKRVTKAVAYICGLGYFELYLNGHKVGKHVLDPMIPVK